jgi:hypothetical protein
VHSKVVEENRYKRLERVLGREEQRVGSSLLKSRVFWSYYLVGGLVYRRTALCLHLCSEAIKTCIATTFPDETKFNLLVQMSLKAAQ